MHLTATTRGKLRATGDGACPRGPNRIWNAPKRYRPIDIDRSPWDVFKFPWSATTSRESGGVAWLRRPAGYLRPDEIAGNK
jgi:hypothetical protein